MIGSVIKRGNTIYVYDERGRALCTKSGGDIMESILYMCMMNEGEV